jgi:hypothetical protein
MVNCNGTCRQFCIGSKPVTPDHEDAPMFQTTARMVMSGLAAVALGAITGWVLIDKLPKKSAAEPARASALVVPNPRGRSDEPATSTARPSTPSTAPAPAAKTPAATPTRVATPGPAAKPESAPAAKPAGGASDKPNIRIDPDRGEASLEIGDAGISADKGGRIRAKGPDVDFSFDPEEGSFKIRSPKGTFKIGF